MSSLHFYRVLLSSGIEQPTDFHRMFLQTILTPSCSFPAKEHDIAETCSFAGIRTHECPSTETTEPPVDKQGRGVLASSVFVFCPAFTKAPSYFSMSTSVLFQHVVWCTVYTTTVYCRAWEGCDGWRCNRLRSNWPAILISSFGEKQLGSKRWTAGLNRRLCLKRQSGDCKKPWHFSIVTKHEYRDACPPSLSQYWRHKPLRRYHLQQNVLPSDCRYVLWQREILCARYLQPTHRRLVYRTYYMLVLLRRRSPLAAKAIPVFRGTGTVVFYFVRTKNEYRVNTPRSPSPHPCPRI